MIRRTIVLALVVGLLVSILLGNALAEDHGFWIGPGPRPVQIGDPDWPAFSKVDDSERRFAVCKAGVLWVDPVGPAARRIQAQWEQSALEGLRSLSRGYEVRMLGRTIRIRR